MSQDQKTIEFNRSKIYEKLDYKPQPESYDSEIPWLVQQQIAATNGVHYIDRIGKLKTYPSYELPVKSVSGNKLILDIGCGWGRWLVAGANKGYIPIGMDIRLEFCKTARNVLKDQGKTGYTVVGDLENLPFQDSIFDLIWSFSVIQHTHRKRLENCLNHINRTLNENGFTKLEFPNRDGLRNKKGPVIASENTKDDYNSWVVRYYTINEYKSIFSNYLKEFNYEIHSFLGIGVLKEDLKYVGLKNKIMCAGSLFLTGMSNIIPGMTDYADSLYISAKKKENGNNILDVETFQNLHTQNPNDNLNIVPLLRCPKSGGKLSLSADRTKLVNAETGIFYKVENDIPILISSESYNV